MKRTIPKWFTVSLMVECGDCENGPKVDAWEHPFNYSTVEEALDAATRYYASYPERVTITDVHPSTAQEVREFMEECWGSLEAIDAFTSLVEEKLW